MTPAWPLVGKRGVGQCLVEKSKVLEIDPESGLQFSKGALPTAVELHVQTPPCATRPAT